MAKLNKIKTTMKQLLLANKNIEMPVVLGNLQGVIKADDRSNVYVTFPDGEVITVFNQSVPRLRMWVLVGYRNNRLQVLRSVNAFHNPPQPDIADHDHTWGNSTNPAWIRGEQFLPGLVAPDEGVAVTFKGKSVLLNQNYVPVFEQVIDLSSYVPAEGALFVVLEADEEGVISVLAGTPAAGRELLSYDDIPAPSSDKASLEFAIKLYLGQTYVRQGLNFIDTDIIDLRNSGYGSGGSSDTVAWDGIIEKPIWIDAIESGQLIEYIDIERWSALEGEYIFDFTDFVKDIVSLEVNGVRQDPLTYTLSDDGLQAILDTPLGFDAIVTSTYKAEVI